jgi:hypothetical protein
MVSEDSSGKEVKEPTISSSASDSRYVTLGVFTDLHELWYPHPCADPSWLWH